MTLLVNWCTFFVLNSAWQFPVLIAIAAVLVRYLPKLSNALGYRVWVSCLLLGMAVSGLSTYLAVIPVHTVRIADNLPASGRWKTSHPIEHGRLTATTTAVESAPRRVESLRPDYRSICRFTVDGSGLPCTSAGKDASHRRRPISSDGAPIDGIRTGSVRRRLCEQGTEKSRYLELAAAHDLNTGSSRGRAGNRTGGHHCSRDGACRSIGLCQKPFLRNRVFAAQLPPDDSLGETENRGIP